jgi:hypothetical protein
MTTGYQDTADTIQLVIDDLEQRIAAGHVNSFALEAQLRRQYEALAYVKRLGGLK